MWAKVAMAVAIFRLAPPVFRYLYEKNKEGNIKNIENNFQLNVHESKYNEKQKKLLQNLIKSYEKDIFQDLYSEQYSRNMYFAINRWLNSAENKVDFIMYLHLLTFTAILIFLVYCLRKCTNI